VDGVFAVVVLVINDHFLKACPLTSDEHQITVLP
jgi:hypothetical protein